MTAIRAERLPILLIVALSSVAALIVTAGQPVLYKSEALLSVRPPDEVMAEAIRTNRPYLAPDGHIYDANDPDRQSGPGRYAPRLVAPHFVEQAAHDAGVGPVASDAVEAERIEGADLVRLSVWQPSPDAAERLASALVAKAMHANREEQAHVPHGELTRTVAVVDPPTHPSSPSYPRRSLNLAVGLGLGCLVASAWTAIRRAGRLA